MDAKLQRGLEQGERWAFDELIRAYYPRLMGYACLLLDEQEARDVVQEVFLYLWEHRSRLQFAGGFQSYLFRVCHSRMIDSLKRRKMLAGKNTPLDKLLQCELSWLDRSRDEVVNTICNKELLDRVVALTDELPDKRREVFRLSYLHDMTNAEIAELLHMPRRTVEGHLYHALRYLRGRISREELMALMCAALFSI